MNNIGYDCQVTEWMNNYHNIHMSLGVTQAFFLYGSIINPEYIAQFLNKWRWV